MSILNQTLGATHLRLATAITKGNYTAGRTIGGASNQVMGHWRGMFVRLPTSYAINAGAVFFGRDVIGNGNFNGVDDTSLRISGDIFSVRRIPFVRYRSDGTEAYAGVNGAEGQFTNITPMLPQTASFLVLDGVNNTGTTGTPVWRGWSAVCMVGQSGTVSSQVAFTPINQAWATNSSGGLIQQIFNTAGTTARTPQGAIVEHVAIVQGDFPWDVVNDRPHHDAVAALAGAGSNQFHTYSSLVAAQNSGTLTYLNMPDQDARGRGNLLYHWTLENLETGLINVGDPLLTATMAVNNELGGIVNSTEQLAPSQWYTSVPTLSPLTLSINSTLMGQETVINILGATSGSIITVSAGILPVGFTLNSEARTITGIGPAPEEAVFTLRETLANATNSPRDSFLFFDVLAEPMLGTLTLSPSSSLQNSSVVHNIIGATTGSTITLLSGSLPAGLTLDSAARTISGIPTTLGTSVFVLRETLEGISNSPLDSEISLTVTPATGTLSINEPVVKFFGGQGNRPVLVSGNRNSSLLIERRWENQSTNTPIMGFDWQTVETQVGTAWEISDVLPVGGPYRLRVRYVENTGQTATSDEWLVGTVIVMHGQSGVERSIMRNIPGSNNLNILAASTAQGLFVKLENQNAGGSELYAQPILRTWRVVGETTPNVSHGIVIMINEWNTHNPGHPLCILHMAINGTGMVDWAANSQAYSGSTTNGQPSFRFLGDIGSQPGPLSGNQSGVVEMYASAVNRYCDLHMMMWTPSISSDSGVRASYVSGIDTRFSNSTAAPWAIMPPWRGHRQPPDSSSTVSTRQSHILFVNELGNRGYLGPYWPDTVSDETGGLHSAFNTSPGVPSSGQPVSDGNRVGQGRLASGLGRVAAWVFDNNVKANGPRLVSAWSDNSRATVNIEMGRQVRTINNQPINPNNFWVSINNGTTWARADGLSETLSSTTNPTFTVSLDSTATRVILTPSDGGSIWNSVTTNLRVDYARRWPASPAEVPNEANTEEVLYQLLYDNQQYRGGTNFSEGQRVGNPLQGTNRNGAGVAGIQVRERGLPALASTELWTGNKTATIRMTYIDPNDGLTKTVDKVFTIARI